MTRRETYVLKFRMRFMKGMFIIFLGLLFNYLETWYFGWNRNAASTPEFIMDWISMAIIVIGIYGTASSKIVYNIVVDKMNPERNVEAYLSEEVKEEV